jgi:hypothetical protein
MGDVNNGTHSVGLSLEVDIPDDDTAVVFNYLIMNNGHGGNDAKAKAAQAALNTIAEEIIKHGAITAAAVTVGSFLVPFFASALAAVAGIMAATEAALLLFADCDGLVAAGALPFTCSDLIKKTASGQKIAENANHPGTDSADGCGSNSQYSTACTIATAPSIQTVLDLRGAWASGGVAGPFVSVTEIQSPSTCPRRIATASGSGSQQYANLGQLPTTRPTGPSTGAQYYQVVEQLELDEVPAIETVIDLNGKWMSGGVLDPNITVHGNSISIDMSAPEASDGGRNCRQQLEHFGKFSR